MSTYLSNVNQRLLYARLLGEASRKTDNSHLATALRESGVLQLMLAYRFHLQEIAETYQCSGAETITNPRELCNLLFAREKSPAEAEEIATLIEDSDSWLSQLCLSYESFFQVAKPVDSLVEDAGDSISLVDISSALPSLDDDLLSSWQEKLDEMVQRHREHMVEF